MAHPQLDAVRSRAGGACEYCRLPAAFSAAPFSVDHVIARQHGGGDDLENLAYACDRCNLHKGPNIAGLDPDTGLLTRLFHPRTDLWVDHFEWFGHLILGRTPVGRTTVRVPAMNHPFAGAVRAALMAEGVLLPPKPGA